MFQEYPPVLLNYYLLPKESRVHTTCTLLVFPIIAKIKLLVIGTSVAKYCVDYCENRARTVLFGVDFKKQCDNIQYN